MTINEKLVSLRKENGLSQMQLAEKMNVSRQAISRWEIGTAVPSTDNLKVLSELYSVPVDILLNDNKELPNKDESIKEIVYENKIEKKKKLRKIIYVIAILITVAVILLCTIFLRDKLRDKKQEVIPIENIEGSEVEPDTTNGIELNF